MARFNKGYDPCEDIDSRLAGLFTDMLDDAEQYDYERQSLGKYHNEAVVIEVDGWYDEWLPYLEYVGATVISKNGFSRLHIHLPSVSNELERVLQIEKIERVKEIIPKKRHERLMREARSNLKKFAAR